MTVDAVINQWLKKKEVVGRLEGWVCDYVPKCVEWIKNEVGHLRFYSSLNKILQYKAVIHYEYIKPESQQYVLYRTIITLSIPVVTGA